ncbi:MAG: hypothetical protein C0606_10200 [Hyphomicrobiales bacterium]|mgnify:CR=1 FL=1|nr:MAG: hypothetical protein C0606_10200 [Hyphomicrobiales bacterium]
MKRLRLILSSEPAIRIIVPAEVPGAVIAGAICGGAEGCRRRVGGGLFKQTYPWERGPAAGETAGDLCRLLQRTRKH